MHAPALSASRGCNQANQVFHAVRADRSPVWASLQPNPQLESAVDNLLDRRWASVLPRPSAAIGSSRSPGGAAPRASCHLVALAAAVLATLAGHQRWQQLQECRGSRGRAACFGCLPGRRAAHIQHETERADPPSALTNGRALHSTRCLLLAPGEAPEGGRAQAAVRRSPQRPAGGGGGKNI